MVRLVWDQPLILFVHERRSFMDGAIDRLYFSAHRPSNS